MRMAEEIDKRIAMQNSPFERMLPQLDYTSNLLYIATTGFFRSGLGPGDTAMDSIDRFWGEYFFLHKWYPIGVKIDGMTFLSSEAAYQSRRCADVEDGRRFAGLDPARVRVYAD